MSDFPNPAGGDGGASPGRRERGRMRRRLRRQQRVREALLLDLGALVYELHRQGRREPELLQAKAAELSAVDDEVRALGEALEERQPLAQLVAAGIAGSCETCGSLLTTDARFCSACGTPTSPALEARRPAAPLEPEIAATGNGSGAPEEEQPALAPAEEPPPEPDEPEPEAAEPEAAEPEAAEPEPEAAEPEPEAEPEAAEPEAAEPEPEPEPPPQAAQETKPYSGSWAQDVGTPGPEVPPPRPSWPPAPRYEPTVNRAVKKAQEKLRRGRDWVRSRRQG